MPGRIIQSIKRAGARNPVMMLDELDKLRADYHGDPSAAMLEVLDPEQNKSFTDHYLDVAFDLSDVFFIGTANVTDTIPPALKDRMETIEVSSYTAKEKLEIAKRFLVPKMLKEHGLVPEWIELPDATLEYLITHYTREAGVRELGRRIAHLFRVAAEEIIAARIGEGPAPVTQRVALGPDRLSDILGPPRFFPEVLEGKARPGVATGLAWTPHGGDLLFIESALVPSGKGNLILTGQLGDVMKESAQIALSLARSLADLGSNDLHLHVPAGAIPKDGPSAGITMLVSIASLLTGSVVDPATAMTGEVTLRGAVLPVGGIKEKIIAAHRAQVRQVLLPRRNEPDLREVPEAVRSQIRIVLVDNVEEALAFVGVKRRERPVAA
jgi:ATP-dependent Lon protease